MATEKINDVPVQGHAPDTDVERQQPQAVVGCPKDESAPGESAFKGLGWLDRLLALWILLAMAVGIILGNFVPNIGPALHKGEFVGVSIPIGELLSPSKIPDEINP